MSLNYYYYLLFCSGKVLRKKCFLFYYFFVYNFYEKRIAGSQDRHQNKKEVETPNITHVIKNLFPSNASKRLHF